MMAETDEDKEADVSKRSLKRPLDRVPLKLIIRRKRPENDKNLMPPPPPPQPPPQTPAPSAPSSRQVRKFNPKSFLPVLLLSKYADIAELMTAFETEKPKSLQEIWHSVRQRQQEEENDSTSNGKGHLSTYYESVCDFGADCEMPWLHPVIDANLFRNDLQDEVKSPVADESKNPKESDPCVKKRKDHNKEDINFVDWRYGAARFWYDMMNVPEDCKTFSYGFKLKLEHSDPGIETNLFSDDAYLMVSQQHWEDEVIWNGADIKPEVLETIKSKWSSVGGKEADYKRNLSSLRYGMPNYSGFMSGQRIRSSFPNRPMFFPGSHSLSHQAPLAANDEDEKDAWKSIFPFENEDLVYGTWEDEIIWDAESMTEIPKPKIPTLDPSDENIVLGVPDDVDTSQQDWFTNNPSCVKLLHPYKKNSKIVVNKTGILRIREKDVSPPFSSEDPFNVSNDSYYALKPSDTSLRLKPVGKIIQHAIPVLELRPPFIPTTLGLARLRSFHRPPLKRYSHGLLSQSIHHPVYSLSHEIRLKAKEREEERKDSGGGDVFFMREPEDLSGRDGELVLVEFSEEHPLLMNEVGMCSKIINYYKRTASKDQGPPQLKYGEVVYPHTSPFLGMLSQGQCIQTVENNLYRSPIYEHQIRETDFLVIRTRHHFSIREVDALFVAGQQCPLYEVPAPRTRCATNFARDFLQVHVFRMFKDCPHNPPYVKMDEIKKVFPLVGDINIRKCVKICAEFKRVEGLDSSCWVLRPDFRLPSEEELREMVTPEQCCAHFSMLAAEQRLKDAGYGGNSLLIPPDEDEDEDEEGFQLKIDDEVKAAPWNLSRSFIQAMSGKCLLELVGPAEPTGCGEGFSYYRRPNKPGRKAVVQDSPVEKVEKVTSATETRLLLRKMGVPEKDIRSLSNWELADIARSLSKRKFKMRGKASGKIPKPKPMTTAEHFNKYKSDCQRIFDLQNQVLQSYEELSTDEEEESEDEGSDVEEMGKILEKLISDKKSYSELQQEKEERERADLVKMMMEDKIEKPSISKDKSKKERSALHRTSQAGRVLKINRTFRDSCGREYTRVEFVRQSSVIDVYMKIRTKDEAFIRQFAAPNDDEKRRIMIEKRKIENQLQRIKQKEQVLVSKQESTPILHDAGCSNISQEVVCSKVQMNGNVDPTCSNNFISPPGKKLYSSKMDPKRKCGACGNIGHNKGNRVCPLYCGPVNVAMTEEEEEEYGRQLNVDDQNLVNVDGTKLKLSVKLIKRAEEMKRKTLVLRVPKDIVRKRKRPLVETRCEYLEKYHRPVNRRRVDPVVVLSNAFEAILNEMRDLPDSDPFHFPVNSKVVPHYYDIISQPMNLQTIRENLRQRRYQSRKDFLEDVHQIVQNSMIFNGPQSPFTINANKMLDLCVRRMGEQEEELMKLEETINPFDEEKDPTPLPQGTRIISTNQVTETQTAPKSTLDIAVSESEDDAVLEPELLDVRACPIVP